MANVNDVAKYFLAQVDEEAGDLISNLKLQKLVYYAQGFHLALYGVALFDAPIEAWQHGPVVPELYHAYKEFGSSAIPCPEDFDFQALSVEARDLLDEVYSVYGQFSAWKLRDMTHDEAPWKETSINCVISHETLRDYFKTRLKN
jgi:uncharacterized phage-associated protein